MQYPFFFWLYTKMFNTKMYDEKENIIIYALDFVNFKIATYRTYIY